MSDLSAVLTWREPYFTDAAGREWHVYDCVRSQGLREVSLGSPSAEFRVFVARDRTKLVYQFDASDAREPTAERLERQLKLAKSREAWASAYQPVRRARR